ncbi:glycoside hydrolase family 88/105 protein [Sphingomonas crusticola]|uniref:glycoside hydrolase family 88/105 protein n=1 Tax=Sphingomonas crusticola TaxID=1697973 RepID=UPI000E2386BF|nr:glycoside hydrolase family 88 protein [Sphingomonas crusticola]
MTTRAAIYGLMAALTLLPVRVAAQAVDPRIAAERLADWQLARLHQTDGMSRNVEETADARSWMRAAFWIGLTALADRDPQPRFRDALLAMGKSNGWASDARPYHADAQAILQPYLWAVKNGAGPAARGPARAKFDYILAHPPRTTLAFYSPPGSYDATECLTRWCWCDALFMAPAGWIEMSRQTGDRRYAAFALKEFWATTDFLYDPKERLFYRDSRFFERRDAQGRKLFWARGNGWVIAGMARTIPLLPKNSPDRIRMEGLFREMAARLVPLQKPDGTWPPSLLAPENSPPESSGTGFFTYGLAWGIEAGLLDRAGYEPAVRKGWAALVRAIQPDGRLGWVQQVSDQPDRVAASDTQFYGVGAFLLAASAIDALDGNKRGPALR